MRIRSIKPEFWRSEDVTSLDWETRLLFIGLWSYVDDNGVGRDVEKLILADLFPLEDDPRETLATVSRGLQALSDKGLIVRYHVNGTPLLHITTWASHQRIDKPNKPRYEPPTCANAVIRETLATVSRDTRESPAPGAVEQRNRGTEDKDSCASASAERRSDPDFDTWWAAYPRKRSKGQAVKAYKAAKKKTSAPTLLAAVLRQGPSLIAKGVEFAPYPATWLNGECWEDEAETSHVAAFRPPRSVHTIRQAPGGMSPQEYAEWEAAGRMEGEG